MPETKKCILKIKLPRLIKFIHTSISKFYVFLLNKKRPASFQTKRNHKRKTNCAINLQSRCISVCSSKNQFEMDNCQHKLSD